MSEKHIRLINPHTSYKQSYIDLLMEFKEIQEPLIPFPLKLDYSDFPKMIGMLKGYSEGRNLKSGFVPHSTYWLIADDEVVGVVNLRHELTANLLKEGGHIGFGVRPSARNQGYATVLLKKTITKAVEKGISAILVTCEKKNIASARVIQKNGGILDSEVFSPTHNDIIQRYWIYVDQE